MAETRAPIFVVAIDFGTAYSGYAFSNKSDFAMNPLKITANHGWNDGESCLSMKTPTCLLVSPDGIRHSFGYVAEREYATRVEKNEHNDWYYFRKFKMSLYKKDDLTRETSLNDENGKPFSALGVFAMSIDYLKCHFLELINASVDFTVKVDDAMWVITIPAIWNDKARQFMIEAAIKAGINENNVSLVLEPEAAAMYCKQIHIQKQVDEQSTLTSFNAGSKFMVVDFGGGTVDITVEEVVDSVSLRELYPASGGPWGGTEIEKEYFKRLRAYFGEVIFQKFEKEHLDDKLHFERIIELKKRMVTRDDSNTVNIRLPLSLLELFDKKGKGKLKNPKDGLGIIKIAGDKMFMQAEVFKSLFDRPIQSTVEHIKEILSHEETSDVATILLVGGFAECEMVKSAISRSFGHLKVIVPDEAGLAVLKGAVILGHTLKGISQRKSRFTYGIEVSDEFQPGIHPEEKRRSYLNSDRCVGIFHPIMEQNEEIIIGETFYEQVFYPASPDDKGIRITVYVAENHCPKFVTDNGCIKLGHVDVPLPIKRGGTNRQITVRMSFGYSEIKVVGTDETTGRCFVGICDFLQ